MSAFVSHNAYALRIVLFRRPSVQDRVNKSLRWQVNLIYKNFKEEDGLFFENNTYFELISLFALKKHIEIDLDLSKTELKELVKSEDTFFSSIEKTHLLDLMLNPENTLKLIKDHMDALKEEEKAHVYILSQTSNDDQENDQKQKYLENLIGQLNETLKAKIDSKIELLQKERISSRLKECSESVGCDFQDEMGLAFTQTLLEYLLLNDHKKYEAKLINIQNAFHWDKETYLKIYKRSYSINLALAYLNKLSNIYARSSQKRESNNENETFLGSYKNLLEKFREYNLPFDYEENIQNRQNEKKEYLNFINTKIEETKKRYHDEGYEIIIKQAIAIFCTEGNHFLYVSNPETMRSNIEKRKKEAFLFSKSQTTSRIKKAEEIGTKRALKETFIIKE